MATGDLSPPLLLIPVPVLVSLLCHHYMSLWLVIYGFWGGSCDARSPRSNATLSYHLICLFDMFPFICLTLSYIVLAHAHRFIATNVFVVMVRETGGEGRGGGDLQPVRSRSIFAWRLAIWVHLAGPKQAAIGGRVGCGPLGAEGAV